MPNESPRCTILCVCALHEQQCTLFKGLDKFQKCKFNLQKPKKSDVFFSRGCKSLMRWSNVQEALASGKVVYREVRTEGSQTAKSGTDVQKRHMRL